jgi:hypothetical protein
VLLGQCNSQLERAQQAVDFNQQWENLLKIVQISFEKYQNQLIEIREEQNSLVHLDTIQVIIFDLFESISIIFHRIFNKFDYNVNRI